MEFFLVLAFLFFVGSMFGWVLELFYRRFFSNGKWVNPGFLVGPYLPLYGFGLCIFYLLAQININPILLILVMGITVTIIEYIAGLIFIKGMGIALWDYSNQFGNIDGIICPLYSLFWTLLGAVYFYLINPYVIDSVHWFENNITFSFFIGIFFGVILIDFAYSTQLVVKIRKFAKENNLIVKYEELKLNIIEEAKKKQEKYPFIFAISNNVKKLEEHINNYKAAQLKEVNKIKRTIHLFLRTKQKKETN